MINAINGITLKKNHHNIYEIHPGLITHVFIFNGFPIGVIIKNYAVIGVINNSKKKKKSISFGASR